MRWAANVPRIREKNELRVLVRKPEGKRPIGRPRHSWEDNIVVCIAVVMQRL
jgi:hypothetical protein